MDKILAKVKEPRLFLCIGILVAGLLPWYEVIAKIETSGIVSASSESKVAMIGYESVQYSILGILIFLLPIALLVLEFLPQLRLRLSSFYLISSVLGILISIVAVILCKGSAASASSSAAGGGVNVEATIEASLKIGFWVIIALYIAIFAYTLIKDYAMSKDTLKEKGIKGMVTGIASSVTKEFADNVSNISSDIKKQ